MRVPSALALALAIFLFGCKPSDGPKIDEFKGRLTRDGAQVSFPSGENVQLQLIHEKGQSFGIPIQEDGTFKIGWMPVGKYSAILKRDKGGAGRGAPSMYSVPGGFAIQEGQTEYTIDLGKNWKL